ncbi:glycoside hydrolase family 92 protein [Maribellus comscasis]|uniref:Glycoside hydrolase family 92 protein n=1 Tax=Maribellus comscasis TaxID=2681766 RepID=A0A6I6JIK0_9BACT|nr:GH92 family glycosyl hydrolase [Maribellus comscasis]QGY42566.1 glycoside hydrolase family 92 protein [Maribellus comscasis]
MSNLNFKEHILLFLSLLFVIDVWAQDMSPTDLVNPFIDTGAPRTRWFYFSSACRPFGMVNLSPDMWTKGDWGSGYLYDEDHIRCFSHIHAWEMGGVAVMPTVGEFQGHKGMEVYKSKYSHEGEIAKPGFHKVFLDDYGVQVELTSTTRVGFHKYTFPASEQSYILFDGGAHVGHGSTVYAEAWRVNDTDIAGYEIMEGIIRRPKDFPVYYYARLSKPFQSIITWKDSSIVKNTDPERISGWNSGLAVKYSTKENEEILLKVAISYVSVEQAKLNLETELSHWEFEQVKEESFKEWNNWLSRIEIEGGTNEQQVKFYTDLWHSLLGRRTVSDVDGKYMDMTGPYPRVRRVRLSEEGVPLFPHYNFDAWWGSQWSLNILWSMVYPEVMDAFCNTMVDIYQNGGLIPRGVTGGNYSYVMIGDPASSFFATAYNKGIRNYDTKLAYEGLQKNAFPGGIRERAGYEHRFNPSGGGISYYIKQGYVPHDRPNIQGYHSQASASMTLEYAYQDWCLAQLALTMNKIDDFEYFMKRSQNYKNLWNAKTGYIQPKDMNGNWVNNFDPLALSGFCESNSAIYSHFVPHDISGLIKLNGGSDRYVQKLDKQFKKSELNGFCMASHKIKNDANWTDYCNQPGTGMAHLFNHAGAPWLTQYWVRKIKDEYSNITPYGGYKGDEDQGQMGALGVLMAIGLFEMDGGASANPIYEITSPIFKKIIIHLDSNYYPGKDFIIDTENNSDRNIYIQNAILNGKAWNKYWFSHEDFKNGGFLKLTLGSKPNKKWGVE